MVTTNEYTKFVIDRSIRKKWAKELVQEFKDTWQSLTERQVIQKITGLRYICLQERSQCYSSIQNSSASRPGVHWETSWKIRWARHEQKWKNSAPRNREKIFGLGRRRSHNWHSQGSRYQPWRRNWLRGVHVGSYRRKFLH